jgi:hypothetical protein
MPELSLTEYCPKCGQLLPLAADDARLCDTCGWFGDQEESLPEPPPFAPLVAAVDQVFNVYRCVCRQELLAEAAHQQDPNDPVLALAKIHREGDLARQALIEMFIGICPLEAP